MNDTFIPCVGAVFSADIAVPEHDREVQFYSRVLSTGEKPLWREDDLMNNLGIPIIGLGERSDEYARLPLQWMPHVQVADVATSAQRALDLGGKILMHAEDDKGTSQWAVLLDPNGAAFGVVPVVPAEAIPPAATDSHDPEAAMGSIRRLDMTVQDSAATVDFYQEVIGWSVQTVDRDHGSEGHPAFNMLASDGSPVAAVRQRDGENEGLPPVWMICLPVGDVAESLRRVQVEGGRLVRESREDGESGHMVIQDPVGAYLALLPA
jgi:uncharacterized protein